MHSSEGRAPWTIPQPRLIEVAPAGAEPFVVAQTTIIAMSHRAERGERVAARQLQQALRACGVHSSIVPQARAGAPNGAILLAVRDRDEPAFGAAMAPASVGPATNTAADPARGESAPPLVGQATRSAPQPTPHTTATVGATSSQEKPAGGKLDSPLAGAAEAYTLVVEATRVTLWAAAPTGLARGVQTLCQLLAQAHQRATGVGGAGSDPTSEGQSPAHRC